MKQDYLPAKKKLDSIDDKALVLLALETFIKNLKSQPKKGATA